MDMLNTDDLPPTNCTLSLATGSPPSLATPCLPGIPQTTATLFTLNSTSPYINFTSPLQGATSQEDPHAFVWAYVSPVILVLGTAGNLLTLLVMRRRRLRQTTTSVYLSLMSVADTGALVSRIVPESCKALRWFSFSDLNRWTCKLEKFTFYTSSDVAIWILVAFTFDRLIAVCFPLHKRHVCVPRTALVVCSVIFLLAVFKNAHVFWTRDVTEAINQRCGWVEQHKFFEEFVRPWIAFALVSILPFFIILVCNSLIVRTLTAVGRLHAANDTIVTFSSSYAIGTGSGPRTSTAGPGGRMPSTTAAMTATLAQSQDRRRRKTTFAQTSWMCLSVSLTFLVCVTPSIVLSIGRAYWSRGPNKDVYNAARTINNQLACLNHAVNFFLYCLTGQRFRTELVRMFRAGNSGTIGSGAEALGWGTTATPSQTVWRFPIQSSTSLLTMQVVRGAGGVGGVGGGGAGARGRGRGVANGVARQGHWRKRSL